METETMAVENDLWHRASEEAITWRILFQAIRAQDILIQLPHASPPMPRAPLYAVREASDKEVQLEGEFDLQLLAYDHVRSVSFAYDISTRMISIAVIDYDPQTHDDTGHETATLHALLELIRSEHIPFTLKDDIWEQEEYQVARPYIHILNPSLITHIDEKGFEMEGIGWGVYPQRIEYAGIHEITVRYLYHGNTRASVSLITFSCEIHALHGF